MSSVYCDRCEEGIDLDNYSLYTLAKYKNSEHVYKALKVLCTPCADELIEFMDTRDNTPRLTREQAAILTAFTGITCGPFEVFHEYAQKLLGRPKHAWQCSLCGKTFTAFTDPDGDGTRSMWIQEYAHIKACPKAPRPGRKQK